MKTPEKIKKGLAFCAYYNGNCEQCNYEYGARNNYCMESLAADALSYIQQLEAEIKILKNEKEEIIELAYRLERERDAAVHDLTESQFCHACKHCEEKEELAAYHDVPAQCVNCAYEKSQFLWRGPLPEPPKEEEK